MNDCMKGNNNKKQKIFGSVLFWFVVFVLAGCVIYFMLGIHTTQQQPRNIQSNTFTRELKDNRIKSFNIRPNKGVYEITGRYKKPQKITVHKGMLFGGLKEREKTSIFKAKMLKSNTGTTTITKLSSKTRTPMHTKATPSAGFWSSMLINILPNVLFLIVIIIMISQVSGGSHKLMNLGQHEVKPAHSKVRFSDVAGEDSEKQELEEVVDFLKDPKKYTKLGAVIPHGVLLEGPPGTGKTLLAEAVAGEANVPFYSVSGSDFVQMFVGVGASRVRGLFKQAKNHSPAIVFIDEIDAIGGKRSSGGPGGGDNERNQTLNQLLVEMNGFGPNEGVIVIGATNRADTLDPALTRPGRFDRKVLVGKPDVRGRYDILKVHSKKKPFAKNIQLKEIARQTPGFVGADLANLLNEAAILAARYNHKYITNTDLSHAEDRVIAGPAKKDAVINPQEKRIVSDHEAGHTIVGLVLSDARKVHKVTIIPRGHAGGFTIMLPKSNENIISKHNFKEQLIGLMGGRVGEQICWHTITTGAVSDFKQATKIARAMVMTFGMDKKLGFAQYEGMTQDPYAKPKYSEYTAHLADDEINKYLNDAYRKAYKIIQTHREQHKVIAQALMKYETLDASEISSLFKTGHMPKNDPKVSE